MMMRKRNRLLLNDISADYTGIRCCNCAGRINKQKKTWIQRRRNEERLVNYSFALKRFWGTQGWIKWDDKRAWLRYLPKGVGTQLHLHSQSLSVQSKMKTSPILLVNHQILYFPNFKL
jgi:hypothetical protein